jgi:phosphoglycerol transferase MdoB-like AlkP superfamily enzyme
LQRPIAATISAKALPSGPSFVRPFNDLKKSGAIDPLSMAALITAICLFFGLIGRIQFLALSAEKISALELILSLVRGTIFDLSVAAYFSAPFLPLYLLPPRHFDGKGVQRIFRTLFAIEFFLLVFSVAAEAFFIEEFHARFNFIAVDYLVYTNEVLRNLWESYPLWWILPLLFVFSTFASRLLFDRFSRWHSKASRPGAWAGSITLASFMIAVLFVTETGLLGNASPNGKEISKNGIHALFAAYRNNEIDYQKFYSRLLPDSSAKIVHEEMEKDWPKADEAKDNESEDSIATSIVNKGTPHNYNVVLVLMESMSARFMRTFGADKTVTPNLDRIARKSLFFDRVYSTGTRTVRGIEAILLSIPPTPGQSIVRRPGSSGLFSMGSVFFERGYTNQFIYGGHAYFDNMKDFFSGNHFDILDENEIPVTSDYFSNAWGVADENLFSFVIDKADENWVHGRPFFQFVLTTSNHRPYTYPNGRIDIPSHSGRDGAVKYADYAIGKFLSEAKKKPWFKSTIFIFVADHNGSVAGGTKVLPADYHIPLIFYAPAILNPKRVSILGSQLDLAPTLFGLLNLSYQSRFFGHDLLNAKTERAFIGTYENVGYWSGGKLVLLSPNRKIEVSEVKNEIAKPIDSITGDINTSTKDDEVKTAVAFYEAASNSFRKKHLKESDRIPAGTNLREQSR